MTWQDLIYFLKWTLSDNFSETLFFPLFLQYWLSCWFCTFQHINECSGKVRNACQHSHSLIPFSTFIHWLYLFLFLFSLSKITVLSTLSLVSKSPPPSLTLICFSISHLADTFSPTLLFENLPTLLTQFALLRPPENSRPITQSSAMKCALLGDRHGQWNVETFREVTFSSSDFCCVEVLPEIS